MLVERLAYHGIHMPDQKAVVAEHGTLSYRELWDLSQRVAVLLREAGVQHAALVAIYTKRDVWAIVNLFAVLTVGATYTFVEDDGAIDENYHRLKVIAPDIVLCDDEHEARLRSAGLVPLIRPADLPVPASKLATAHNPDDTAYVLYTSGSTGAPKGVAVTHRNIEHYTRSIRDRLAVRDGLSYAHISTLSADLGNTSIFLSILTGGTLHLIKMAARKDPAEFRRYIGENAIAVVKMTPSHWNAMFPAMAGGAGYPDLEYLILGGEAFSKQLARNVLASGKIKHLHNHYGPTETTVGVTTYHASSVADLDSVEGDAIPIGYPLGDTILVVQDGGGSFHDREASGELYVGGPSVANGYRDNAAATGAAFVLIPINGQQVRCYKTGDLVSIDQNGLVRFAGRVDRQVKVNGHRIELEHVEAILRVIPFVADASVAALEIGGRLRLVAAVTGVECELSGGRLRSAMQRLTPEYMIPSQFIYLEDFPRNENGKVAVDTLKTIIADRTRLGSADYNALSADDAGRQIDQTNSDRRAKIALIFNRYVRSDSTAEDDDFFALGGDSLDAILLIAELQDKGYPITANAFLQNPTQAGILRCFEKRKPAPTAIGAARSSGELTALSPAQRDFFRQKLLVPDHYNQALLLKSAEVIDIERLHRAIKWLLQRHPSLSVAYQTDDLGIFARHTDIHANDIVGVSFIAGMTGDEVEKHFATVSARMNASLSLESGALFRVHLFKGASGGDHIYLVAHHLAVDLISWRIIVGDLGRHYGDPLAAQQARSPSRRAFWDWIEHLEERRESLNSVWVGDTIRDTGSRPAFFSSDNLEGNATTLWIGYAPDATSRLGRAAEGHAAIPLHIAVLAGFATAIAKLGDQDRVVIDVESHGRLSLDEAIDESRIVGWHTSTYPLQVAVDADSPAGIADATSRAWDEVPKLGVGFGLHRPSARGQYRPSAAACFNFLGDVDFRSDDTWRLSPATIKCGPTRHPKNNRGHKFKLTVKVLGGRLIIDLSYPQNIGDVRARQIADDIDRYLCSIAGGERLLPKIAIEPGTATGMINYAPQEILDDPIHVAKRDYADILITGATGFIGIYALMELLAQTTAHLHCIVRQRNGLSGGSRLRDLIAWYFPDVSFETLAPRITVHEGDIEQFHFGLAERTYQQLALTIDAVYHFAADTRLLGTEDFFHRANVGPVEACIGFAQSGRIKDVHYCSTLAVSGVSRRPHVMIFDEDALDIGQDFHNGYEASKFAAEQILNVFRRSGGNAFIYRPGNVSGCSAHARFQHNAKANRLIQLLSACIKLRQLPDHCGAPVVLAPVDEVAAAIVSLSLDAASMPGTYHTDSPHEIAMDRLFAALERAGLSFDRTGYANFHALFSAADNPQDAGIQLGRFWSAREDRRIRYRHERTLRVLDRLGRQFSVLDDRWLDAFIGNLIDAGAFVDPGDGGRPSCHGTADVHHHA